MSSKIEEKSDLAKLTWAQVVTKVKDEGKNVDKLSLGATIDQLFGAKFDKGIFLEILADFFADPDQWVLGGNANALQVHQNIVRAKMDVGSIRDFCIIYICSGKNIPKMAKGPKSAPRTAKAISLQKKFNLKDGIGSAGYQTETVAIALAPFMIMFREILGEKGHLPEPDKEFEESVEYAGLPKGYRWIGSIAAYPFVDAASGAAFITAYEKWVDDYIKRRANGSKAATTNSVAIAERRKINRSYYLTQATVFDGVCKRTWSANAFDFGMPGVKSEAAVDMFMDISAKLGFKVLREQDLPQNNDNLKKKFESLQG